MVGSGYDCSHSIYDNESDVGFKIQSACTIIRRFADRKPSNTVSFSRTIGKYGNPQLVDFYRRAVDVVLLPVSFKKTLVTALNSLRHFCFGSPLGDEYPPD